MRILGFTFVCFVFINENYGHLSFRWDNSIQEKPVSPVIYIPGDGGSQIDAKLDKPNVVHYICQKKTDDFFNVWLNLELLVPLVIDCWIDNVRLYYDNATRTTHNSPGVTTKIPGWGSSETVEWLDPSHAASGAYFKDIGNALLPLGYERNFSIRGAPYDFRKAPNENQQWFIDFKALIEATYVFNGNTPVTLIAHSMGGPMTLLFLQRQSQSWKDKYISKFITLCGAWAGSVKAVKVYAIGDDLGSHFLQQSVMREEQITNPSLAWLLPSKLFWKPDEVFIEMKSRNYTMGQLEEFFTDLDYPIGWEMRKDTEKFTEDFTPPGVEVHCLYGSGVDTVERLVYKGDAFTSNPKLMGGDGDGTVNARSLEACKLWSGKQKQKVFTQSLPNIDHMMILADSQVIKYIVNVLSN